MLLHGQYTFESIQLWMIILWREGCPSDFSMDLVFCLYYEDKNVCMASLGRSVEHKGFATEEEVESY